MKRLSPEVVASAYVKSNLVPYAGHFKVMTVGVNGAQTNGCCGLGALAVQREWSGLSWDELGAHLGLHKDYTVGFVGGFDGDLQLYGMADNEHYLQGYVDGIGAHLAALVATGYLTLTEKE